jgi:hypothetical protein
MPRRSALSSPVIGESAVDCSFDPVQLSDPVERLLGDRRSGRGVHVKELASHMRPAGSLGDAVAGEQLVESGVAIGMDHTAEVAEMGSWVLAFAVRRVKEQRRRWPLAVERTFVTNIHPQPSGLGFASAGRQHGHRRVVDVQCVRCHDLGGERVDQRLQGCRCCADPAG